MNFLQRFKDNLDDEMDELPTSLQALFILGIFILLVVFLPLVIIFGLCLVIYIISKVLTETLTEKDTVEDKEDGTK